MSATTSIELDRVGPTVAILRISGDITSGSEGRPHGGLHPGDRRRRDAVVLDFSGLEYMNSGGIGLLVTLLVRAQRGRPADCWRPACPTTTARSSH